MLNRNDYDSSREGNEAWMPSSSPEEEWDTEYSIADDERASGSRSLSERFGALSPNRQLGYGCIGIIILSALLVYCVGAATVLIRPILAERAAISPTPMVRSTLVPTPTQETKPTFIQLPPGKLVATPTQAPIPTREPPTVTPTTEMVNGMTVTPSPTPTGKVSATPTRKPTTIPTAKP